MYTTNNSTIYVLVYVDDIIITGNNQSLLHSLTQQLNTMFSLKELGDLDYFLGIEVHPQPDGLLFLTQTKYIRDLLTKINMFDTKPVSSPMVASNKLIKKGSAAFVDTSLYRSIVGSLQYATITRLEISFAVNKVCQFMANPLQDY